MITNDVLAVAIGVFLGVLVSIPVALFIAVSTNSLLPRYHDLDPTWQQDTTIDVSSREIVLFDADNGATP